MPPDPSDRRPIASRNLPLFQKLAAALAQSHISANAISLLSLLFSLLAAAALAATPYLTEPLSRLAFLAAAALIQLRLLANMLDGMVAIVSHTASNTGELFNEIPDRLSDTAVLLAAGYAANSDPTLGWTAALLALFVTYIRALAKSLGVPGLFHGPMSKSHRMFTLTLACLYLAAAPAAWSTFQIAGYPFSILQLTLALIILGALITALRRLAILARSLKERP